MPRGVTELLMKITGDNKDAVKKLNEIDGKMSQTADNFMKAAKVMAAAFVASHIVDFGKDAIDSALRAEEAANKFKTVFGPAVEDAGRFVDDYAQRLGFSHGEMTGLLGSIGAVVTGMGVEASNLADLSTDIALLGADLASFHDTGVRQAIQSIISALTGERESLKTSFGIVIKEADVVRQALIMTGKDSARELTELDKVMATMALVTIKAELQGAIGDLDRTMDDNVAKVRDLSGAWAQFQEDIGQLILPVFGSIVTAISDVITWIESLYDVFASARDNLAGPLEDMRNEAAQLAQDAPGYGQIIGDFVIGATEGLLFVGKKFLGLNHDIESNQAVMTVWEQDLSGSFAEVEDAAVNNALAFAQWQEDASRSVMQASRDFSDNFAEIDQATVNNQIAFDLWEQELSETLTEAVNVFDGAADEIEISIDEMMANITASIEQNTRFQTALSELARRGLDSLVAELEAAGPGAASAAENFVANPIEAAIADMALAEITDEKLTDILHLLNSSSAPLSAAAQSTANAIGLTWDSTANQWVVATDKRMGEISGAIANEAAPASSAIGSVGSGIERVWNASLGRFVTSTNTSVQQVKDSLYSLNGIQTFSNHTHTITNVTRNITHYGTSGQSVYANAHGTGIEGFAGGGQTAGLAMVGEYGPELVTLPKGSTVTTAHNTRRMKASGGTYNVYVAGSIVTERELLDVIRRGLIETQNRNGTTGIL